MSRVLDQAFDQSEEPEERASGLLAGGIMQHGYQCGMIWGATLAAGARAYRLLGASPQAEARAIMAAQRLVESFRAQNTHVNCVEITDIDKSSSTMQMITYFLLKGGTIGCFRRAAKYAPIAFSEIDAALSDDRTEAPAPPVSCAAVLARKMGASELQAVMAAGFAGGIGLCGGACGALGAALWITGLHGGRKQDGKTDPGSPLAEDVIDRFVRYTDCEFECSKIVGQRFETLEDHAAHLRNGGCSRIIEVLAAERSADQAL